MTYQEEAAREFDGLLNTEAAIYSEIAVPATERQIIAAESSMRLGFPSSYRVFLKRCGAFNTGYTRIYGVVDPTEDPDRRFADVVYLTDLHRTVESLGVSDLTQIIFIADDENGYFFYSDATESNGEKIPIYMWTEDVNRKRVADDFLDFLRKIILADSNHPFNED